MNKFTIDISSYDTFRKATFGKAFDIDNYAGAQCFDAADLLWRNIRPEPWDGNRLRSSNGGASGAWIGTIGGKPAKEHNARDDFKLIPDVTKVKRGDVIVFGEKLGSFGHIGFADEDYSKSKTKIATFSQNQGGTDGKGQAAAFSVKSYSVSALIGAFRYKAWNVKERLKGDIDGDGDVDIMDALEIEKKLAGLPNVVPIGKDKAVSDVNGDGKVDVMDALEIQKKLAGLDNVIDGKLAVSVKSVDDVAREVIAGKWGNGSERVERLEAAGYDIGEVQKKVNDILAEL